MIKAMSGETLILILSERNLELLRQGRPISFSVSELGKDKVAKSVIISWATTEAEGLQMLSEGITADTRIIGKEN